MYGYIFFGFSCLYTCVHAEECFQALFAKRESFHVPMGGDVLLSCVVQHCGENNWTSIWTHISTMSNKSDTTVCPNHLTSQTLLSANKTRLVLQIQNLKKSDEGLYGCKVKWKGGGSSQGNLQSLILTAPERSEWHRALVLVSALLCTLLLLLMARCLSSGPHPVQTRCTLDTFRYNQIPQPLPRCPIPQTNNSRLSKVSSKPEEQRRTSSELVYADVALGASREPQIVQEPSQSIIYSSVRHGAGAAM
ncbi:uncharacterized protein si:dkey-52l18.4 isoform X1 [Gadus chalcogrammus]|uniref:uncharacterized protein si:dkey-52l18.4 isoform X1 n=1 Tax=Gadus chalcogrammus TaxID=1042646 RepID=UPI0024C4E3AC|nr:uncharacterized protein si:dkey-52l18.4 isoform X1 [Gadus chalcogrammus]